MKQKTGKQYTPTITKRFLLLMDEVLRDGSSENRGAFAKSIGEHSQNLSAMENGTRSPTLEHIAMACKIYGYSPTWLILGVGEKHLKPRPEKSIDRRVTDLEMEVSKIKRLVKK